MFSGGYMKRRLLSLAIASFSTGLLSHNVLAEEALIYVRGADVNELELRIQDELFFFDKSGIAVVNLPAGSYSGSLALGGEPLGSISISIPANKDTEIKVEVAPDAQLSVTSSSFDNQENIALGSIVGRVFASGGTEPLVGAKVRLEDTEYDSLTDDTGAYILEVPRGVYNVVVSQPGFTERTIDEVRVLSDVAMEVSMSLPESASDGAYEEVLILGVWTPPEESALAIERDSTSVVSAISSEDFKKFGDSSASDALKRVTGVSVVGGQFAVVRGLAGRYISTTLNDGYLPSPDTSRRDVPLDLFPSSVLGSIAISKSFTADLPADSTGGHVGMTLKEVPKDFVSKVSVKLGHNSATTGEDVYTYKGGSKDWLGVDDGTRELPTEVDQRTNYGQDPLPSVCVDGVNIPGCAPQEELAELGKSFNNDLQTYTNTAPVNHGISYALGNNFGDFGVYASVDYQNAWKSRADASYIEQIFNATGQEDSRVLDYSRSQQAVDLTGYLALEYQNDAGLTLKSKSVVLRKTTDTTTIENNNDLTEGRETLNTTLEWVERQMVYQQLAGEHILGANEAHKINWSLAYAVIDRDEPDRRSYAYLGESFSPSSSSRSYARLDEDITNINLNYSFDTRGPFGAATVYKLGIAAFDKSRESIKSRFNYNQRSELDLMQPVNDVLSDENFDAGLIRLGYQTLSNDRYLADEKLAAFYGSGEWDFNSDWVINLGFRSEDFKQEINYPNSAGSTSAVAREYSNLLPSLNITWRQSDDWQLRMAIGQTVSRPGLVEINASSQVDPDTNQQIIGNPNLVQSEIVNIDLKTEYYFSEEEKVTVGAFYKDIVDPIEKSIAQATDVFDGYTFRNSNSAMVSGIELEILKNIYTFGDWQNSIGANFSWIESEVNLDQESQQFEGRSSRKLQGQSEYLANIQWTIESLSSGQRLTLLVNYFGDRIDVVNNVANGDRIEKSRVGLDAVYSYDFENGISVEGKIKNILDEKIIYSAAGSVVSSEESYSAGRGISVGVSYEF
jgi:outer membrane receptor protein involved in Fe transport